MEGWFQDDDIDFAGLTSVCFRPAINKQANMNKYSFAFVTNQSLPFLLTVMVDVFLCMCILLLQS